MNGKHLHDQKPNKLRKVHNNSVLKQVMNKQSIQLIEQQRKFNLQSQLMMVSTHRKRKPPHKINMSIKSSMSSLSSDNNNAMKEGNLKFRRQKDKENYWKDRSSFIRKDCKAEMKKYFSQRNTVQIGKNSKSIDNIRNLTNYKNCQQQNLNSKNQSQSNAFEEHQQCILDKQQIKQFINKRIPRRNSKLEIQLDDIVKYSKMYPQTRNSRFMIDTKTVENLLREQFKDQYKFFVKNSPHKGNNSVNTSQHGGQSQKRIHSRFIDQNQGIDSQFSSIYSSANKILGEMSNQKEQKQVGMQKERQDFQKLKKNKKQCDSNTDKSRDRLVLDMVNQCQEFTIAKIHQNNQNQKKVRKIITQSKDITYKQRKKYCNFQLPTFIQQQIQMLENKKLRNTMKQRYNVNESCKNSMQNIRNTNKYEQISINSGKSSQFDRNVLNSKGNLNSEDNLRIYEDRVQQTNRIIRNREGKGINISKLRDSKRKQSIFNTDTDIQQTKQPKRQNTQHKRNKHKKNTQSAKKSSNIANIRKKTGKNQELTLNHDQYNKSIDLREQLLLNIHRFFRGQKSNEQQFSNCISRKQIEDFKQKYNIYKTIYSKIKDDIYSNIGDREYKNISGYVRGEKDSKSQLTMKTAVYLNQALGESNSLERKKALQELADKVNLII